MISVDAMRAKIAETAEAANYWDSRRRALRAVCEPIETECERYRMLLWVRLYGDKHHNERWLKLADNTPDNHPGRYTATSKEVAEIIDAMRGAIRGELKEYRLATDMTKHCEHQMKALEAAIDTAMKVPLKHSRRAPKDRSGHVIQPDIFDKDEEGS